MVLAVGVITGKSENRAATKEIGIGHLARIRVFRLHRLYDQKNCVRPGGFADVP
jgi:hypothetical protein